MPSPRSDRVFKQIFHNHPGSLISLLNAFLPLAAPIESVEYMPMELSSDIGGMHVPIVDVRCRDRRGRNFIVEMQLQKQPLFFRRVFMNACRVYSRQFPAGGDLSQVCPVYTLCLIDYPMHPDDPAWVHHVEPRGTHAGMPSFGEVCFTFVEMRKWMELGTFDVESSRDAWMLFFTQPEKVMEVYTPEQRKRYNEMIEAVEAWDKTKYTEHELWAMERTVQAMWANESYLKMAWKEGREEGRATGRAEGLLEGREEGREEGRHEGREEGREEGRAEGRHEGRQEGQKEGYEQGVSTLFAAWQYLKANPGVSDEQLSARFHLPSEALAAVRAMAGGSDI